jgi:origin recognition complex subunit 3
VKKTNRSDLSIRALSGELSESQIVEDMLATLKTFDSEKLRTLVEPWADETPVPGISEDFQNLVQSNAESGPLQSAYNVNSSVVKTTVEQQRVRLSKGQSQLSEQDLEYTQLIDGLIDGLRGYFTANLINPQDLPLHEVFVFDLRNPLKETFAPRPRFAIERALTSPFDYLISSSDVSETKISAKQPATAILYQLYLESGALVNVHDLWQAFRAVFESDQGDRCDDRVVMALFYSAMSELKTFGMVKNTRKKADHLAKSAWMGL